MTFAITSSQILAFCTLVTALYGLWKIVKEVKKPNDELRDKVVKHEQFLINDDKRLRAIEDSNKMMLQSMLVMLNHNITGNGIEKMKETRDELQDFLIQK